MPNKKLFLIDTDTTLIDGDNNLISPDIMGPVFHEIIRSHHWAIVTSRSHINLEEEPILKAIKEQDLTFDNNSPTQAMLHRGNSAILQEMVEHKGIDFSDEQEKILLLYGEFDWDTGKLTYKNNERQLDLSATVAEDAYLYIELGNSRVTLDARNWLSCREFHAAGDNKLFQAILAMDQLYLSLVSTGGLEGLGFIKMEPLKDAEKYTEIRVEDVVMLEYKKEVLDLMQAAGANTIRVDTRADVEPLFYRGELEDYNELKAEKRSPHIDSLLSLLDLNKAKILIDILTVKNLSLDNEKDHDAIAATICYFAECYLNTVGELVRLANGIGIGFGKEAGYHVELAKLRSRQLTRFHEREYRETNDSEKIANLIIDKIKGLLVEEKDVSGDEILAAGYFFEGKIVRDSKYTGREPSDAKKAREARIQWFDDFMRDRKEEQKVVNNVYHI